MEIKELAKKTSFDLDECLSKLVELGGCTQAQADDLRDVMAAWIESGIRLEKELEEGVSDAPQD